MKKTLLIFFFSGVCCLAQILPDTFDPDARLYFTNVQVNGGMIGIGAKIAVSQFINQCKIDGNWTNLSEVGLFAGVGNFSAALCKLKWTNQPVLVNSNFVAADFTATGSLAGLKGDGSKMLLTGYSIMALSNGFSLGGYVTLNGMPDSQFRMLIGSSYLASGDSDRFYICDITNTAFPNATPAFGMGNLYPEISSWGAFAGFKTIATFGGTNVVAYTNGVSVLSTNSWNGQGFQAGTVFIFSGGSSFSSKDTVSFYFIGNNSLNLARFSAAVNSLMGKFGCNKY